MSDDKVDPAVLRDTINKLKDIEGVYKSLVEKMARIQFDAQEAGLKVVDQKFSKPVRNASDNAKMVGDVIHELEAELKGE